LFSRPRASARCDPPDQLYVELALYEDDPFFDRQLAIDRPGNLRQWRQFGPLYTAVQPFFNVVGVCNEDTPGADELYTKVRARVNTGGPNAPPVWSAWSAWARGPTATFNC
jgi:hypothetical protein